MEQGEIRRVPLGIIRASVDNPRRDFGDLDELAESFKATGGVPFNPIVCAQDGNVMRVVDGERRFRALKTLYHDDFEVPVLVFANASAAHEIVAMLATDDKLRLSESERAQGFQTALALGVDEQDVARVMHRKVSEVRKAKTVVGSAPAQATFDQMLAAADFEGKDQQAILKAAPDKWQACVEGIRRRIAREERATEWEQAIRALEDAGKVLRYVEEPEGFRSLVTAYTPGELLRVAADHEGEELVLWPCKWNDEYWVLGSKVAEAPEETPEEREARELAERREAAYQDLRRRLIVHVASSGQMPAMQKAAAAMRKEGDDWRLGVLVMELHGMGMDEIATDWLLKMPASLYETLIEMRFRGLGWWKWTLAWLPPAIKDGYQRTDEDVWLLEQATVEEGAVLAAKEAEGE